MLTLRHEMDDGGICFFEAPNFEIAFIKTEDPEIFQPTMMFSTGPLKERPSATGYQTITGGRAFIMNSTGATIANVPLEKTKLPAGKQPK